MRFALRWRTVRYRNRDYQHLLAQCRQSPLSRQFPAALALVPSTRTVSLSWTVDLPGIEPGCPNAYLSPQGIHQIRPKKNSPKPEREPSTAALPGMIRLCISFGLFRRGILPPPPSWVLPNKGSRVVPRAVRLV